MIHFFTNIYFKIQKKRMAFFFLVLVALSSCIYFATRINFDEDITNILPQGEENDITAKVLQQLNFSDKITVMVKAKNSQGFNQIADVAQHFLDSLAQDSLFYTDRSEEHTSELQSRPHLVCRLLLEKKKKVN